MRKTVEYIIFIIILLLIYFYRTNITMYAIHVYNYYSGREITVNAYSKDTDYLTYQKTTDFIPDNKQELANVIYTILDDGLDEYMFYCNYDECDTDLDDIADNGMLQAINNYVHPYNSFKIFNYEITMNVVSINIEHNYTDMEISSINAKLNYLLPSIIKNNTSDYDKIKAFHDYIVNTTIYERDDENSLTNDSHKAYNIIVNGKGVCSGYADALEIFLYKLGYNSIKVANTEHVWNAVFLDNNVYNIDMTWDDPLTTDGSEALIHDYFMISTSELQELDKINKHYFQSEYYPDVR